MQRQKWFSVFVLTILLMTTGTWTLHFFLDGGVVKGIACYFVKLMSGITPLAAIRSVVMPQHGPKATLGSQKRLMARP
ncbi:MULTISPECIES: hypothetical protein [unclassified Symbiopectobacterium]|uniref:hypothetical protein n=2 Tax=Symbiopectobacterium TaxID=801 RepID=UPI002226348F|nr:MULTISPECIES: hypothetical protein [unclassified Symbiopectobacterium]MCW2473086.1 hypothetical protein [Candidatus Symbiopectobacterium sp. NZEC151]MCW2488679.1 hypothetical protein [Candidatus Symbiopectobacterium sp. NZEC127]